MTLLYDKVKREFRGTDLEGELRILDDAGFIDVRSEDVYSCGLAEIGVRISSECDELSYSFMDFVEAKQLNLRSVIGDVDLSAF